MLSAKWPLRSSTCRAPCHTGIRVQCTGVWSGSQRKWYAMRTRGAKLHES